MIGIVFSKIENEEGWLPIFYDELVFCWLKTQGIFAAKKVEESRFRCSSIEYNNFYHFYDLSLFPSHNKHLAEMERAIDKLSAKYPDIIDHKSKTWHWLEDKTQLHGFRIWIKATDTVLYGRK